MKEFLPQLTPWAGAVMVLLHPVACAAMRARAPQRKGSQDANKAMKIQGFCPRWRAEPVLFPMTVRRGTVVLQQSRGVPRIS
jgi:hypothetical protein